LSKLCEGELRSDAAHVDGGDRLLDATGDGDLRERDHAALLTGVLLLALRARRACDEEHAETEQLRDGTFHRIPHPLTAASFAPASARGAGVGGVAADFCCASMSASLSFARFKSSSESSTSPLWRTSWNFFSSRVASCTCCFAVMPGMLGAKR